MTADQHREIAKSRGFNKEEQSRLNKFVENKYPDTKGGSFSEQGLLIRNITNWSEGGSSVQRERKTLKLDK